MVRCRLACMAQYFIDVLDGSDWALDPEGIDLPSDQEVEKAAVLALRVLVDERLQECEPLDLVVRVNDEDLNEVFVLRAEIRPRWLSNAPQKERYHDD